MELLLNQKLIGSFFIGLVSSIFAIKFIILLYHKKLASPSRWRSEIHFKEGSLYNWILTLSGVIFPAFVSVGSWYTFILEVLHLL